MLRLEDLFIKIQHHLQHGHEFNHHSALLGLFQILDVIDRAELKADLLQELDRQKNVMLGLAGNPSISETALSDILKKIDAATVALRNNATKLGQSLRDNEWLMGIKQRAVIPGGVCEFDLPSYHYWLGLSEMRRREDLSSWMSTLTPIYDALAIILQILRGSGATNRLQAVGGHYQQMLGGAKPAQMLIIDLPDGVECFPEVSANKYAVNVRFNSLGTLEKPRLCEQDVPFTLTLCNL